MTSLYSDIEEALRLSPSKDTFVHWIERHRKHMKHIWITIVALTILLLAKHMKLSFDHFESARAALSLEESAYHPFQLGKLQLTVVNKTSIKFPLKRSHINREMQRLHLQEIHHRVAIYLNETSQLCMHLRHYEVPYDILFFHNETIINPYVEDESESTIRVKETSLDGTSKRQNRPLWIKLSYYNATLQYNTVTFNNDASFCIAHYLF